MYKRPTRLKTRTCKVCKRKFNSEKCLKDHIFHSKIKSRYTLNFSDKYVKKAIANIIGEEKYKIVSKEIMSTRRKKYWAMIPKEERKRKMKKVLDAQWLELSQEERRNHPWVKAGKKASLQSSITGSKNQKHAYNQLQTQIQECSWIYNFCLEGTWQIDIACPERKVFIEWDGRHHRIPIHGKKELNNRKNRDKLKDKLIINKERGTMIRVKDDGRENKEFVKKKIKEIKAILKKRIEPKVIHI